MMRFGDYDKLLEMTALYPFAGCNMITSAFYPTLGLVGEISEALEKTKLYDSDFEMDRKEILKEAGDVLWYVSALAKEVDTNLKKILENVNVRLFTLNMKGPMVANPRIEELILMTISGGRISEIVKKLMRDGDSFTDEVPSHKKREIAHHLRDILVHLVRFALMLDSSLEEVALLNTNKLLDRRERGKLGGSGDNR